MVYIRSIFCAEDGDPVRMEVVSAGRFGAASILDIDRLYGVI